MESNVTPIKFRNTTKKHRRETSGGKQGMDFLLFFAVCAIALFGVVMLYSASYYKALAERGDGMSIVRNQVFYLAVGIVLMFLISHVDYNIYKRRWLLFTAYFGVLVLLGATLIWGREVLGAKRWLDLPGGFSMQPSELVKFVLVLCMAFYASAAPQSVGTLKGFLILVALAVPHIVLIFFQPNMSMIIIIVALSAIMLFLGGVRLRYLLSVAGIGTAGILGLIIIEPYRLNRITGWLNPWHDTSGRTYQIVQSLFAFANGGFLGQGFDNSRQKLLYLPEMENDYILAIIAEELGFIGVILLLAAFAFVIYRGIRIALSVRDRFGTLVAFGIICALALQVLVNVGVVTCTIPSTGQSLPFISAGGSSLLVFFCAIGILLNISRHTKVSKKPAFKNTDSLSAS